MNRRDFIGKSAVATTLPFWLQGCNVFPGSTTFPIQVHSDHAAGHLVLESLQWTKTAKRETEIVIVGGGLAGLSAAHELRGRNFVLYELSSRLGGSSAAGLHEGISFCQGAHYDLAYPEYYGEEVLRLFEKLEIIRYEPWKKIWSFKDEQHLIPFYRKQQCYENGQIRGDVIREGPKKDQFYAIVLDYLGAMPLPTRLIREEHRHLNQISFSEFLEGKMEVDPAFGRQLSYHMLDDYGGTIDQVSALAGIHYFTCRPYYNEAVDLFSPPQGNHYFVEKIRNKIPSQRLKNNHLLRQINRSSGGFEAEVLDLTRKEVIPVKCDHVIYAGQKHALQYVFPEDYRLFENQYAPWMVVNILTEEKSKEYGFWQNEFLGDQKEFLGFIDSSVQSSDQLKGHRVFSGYYCLEPQNREYLTTIPENKERIALETIEKIEAVLKKRLKVIAAYIHVMGHAMPIPQPGYLFRDANDMTNSGMLYAGVDNGRLPLLYEAIDSGLMTAGRIKGLNPT